MTNLLNSLTPILDRPVLIPVPSQDDAHRAFMERNTVVCQSALDQMIREHFLSSHEVRGDRQTKKLGKSLSPFFLRILNLCERCHTMLEMSDVENQYLTGYSWFCEIIMQFYAMGIPISMQKLYPKEKFSFLDGHQAKCRKNNGAKQRLIRNLLRICKITSELKEPILPTGLAFSNLLEIATSFSKNSTSRSFKFSYFDPFVADWRSAVLGIDFWVTGYVEDGKLFYREGQGRRTKLALPLSRN